MWNIKTKAFKWFAVAAFATLFGVVLLPGGSQAATGINSQVSFEGKVVNSDGTNLADGTYNMQFKIYQDGNGCVGGGTAPCGGTLKWTESRLVINSQSVTVTAGTFQVNLGSVNALTGIDWNQDTLWLSMNIGGTNSTASPTYDGEMTPFIRLTSVPYALNAGMVGGLTAAQLVQLTPASQQSGSINVSGNITGGGLSVTGAAGINTSGSAATSIGNSSSALTVIGNGATTAANLVALSVAGDTNDRFTIGADGKLSFGPGNGATDASIARTAASTLYVTANSFIGSGTMNFNAGFLGTSINGTRFGVNNSGATANVLVAALRGVSGQTGDMLQLQDNNGNPLGGFNGSSQLYYQSGTFTGTLLQGSLTANRTYTLPDASGTICLDSSNCSGYIRNQNASAQTTADFWVSGTGRADGGLLAPSLQSASGSNLSIDTIGANTINLGNSNATAINLGPTGGGTTAAGISLGTATGAAQDIDIGGTATNGGSNSGSAVNLQGGASALTVVNAGISIQSFTNTPTALQVLNNAGVPILVADTADSQSNNLLVNGGFELGGATPTGWSQSGTLTSFARNTTAPNHYGGIASLQFGTNTINTGVIANSFVGSPGAGTYTISFYALLSAGSASSNSFKAFINAGTAVTCTAGTVLNTTGFQRVVCPSVVAPAAITSMTIQVVDATARTVYIDSVQLVSGSVALPATVGEIQLRGAISNPVVFQALSNSTTAFQIQDRAGSANLFIADTLNNRIGIGTSTAPSATLSVGGTSGNFTVTNAGAATATSLQVGSSTANTNTALNTLNNYNAALGTEPAVTTGAMYYNSTINQFRCAVNGAWVSCGGLSIANTATTACTLTITPTACVPNNYFTGAAPTIPANYCSAGRAIRVTVRGIYTQTSISAQTITLSMRLAGTIIGGASNTLNTPAAAITNAPWQLDYDITCDSTTTVTGEGWARVWTTIAAGNSTFNSQPLTGTTTTTVTNTSAQAIAPYFNWGTATAGNAATVMQFIVKAM